MAGDGCLQEIKQGYLATKQAAVVTENIKKSVKDPFTAKLTEYNPATAPFAIVSLGRNLGLMQMPLGTFVGRLPGMLKSKDLFVGSSRKALGLSAWRGSQIMLQQHLRSISWYHQGFCGILSSVGVLFVFFFFF
jgi:hypothetical protein